MTEKNFLWNFYKNSCTFYKNVVIYGRQAIILNLFWFIIFKS